MNIETIKSVYFVGAGGIGMSALVRYFLFKGKVVAGYDRTPTPLTETLISEGAQIHYEENVDLIPEACKDKESTLVIYRPFRRNTKNWFISVTTDSKYRNAPKYWEQLPTRAKVCVWQALTGKQPHRL